MSFSKQQSLFFVSLPDLHQICATRIVLKSSMGDPEIWSRVLRMCRQLLFLHQDILISPVPDIASEIWVVMTISFYKSGKLDAYFEKYEAKVETPQRVTPQVLQSCLLFTLTAKLAPAWNKVGHLLVQGRDFLSQVGKQNAVVLDITVTETQICLNIEAYIIRLPPPQIEDFAVSQDAIKEFYADKKKVIQEHSILNNWCYVLPSLKLGQIRSMLHSAPPSCPLHSYGDFQKYWMELYGCKLPEDHGNGQVYCSVQFKTMGERYFTYPLSCIRSQPLQFFPRVDMEGVLRSFLLDLNSKMPQICGFPVKMTTKNYYYTNELTNPRMLENKARPPNLTTQRGLELSLTQAPPCSAPSLVQSSVAEGHKVELSAGQPAPQESARPPKAPQAQGLVPGTANPPSQGDTPLGRQGSAVPKLVPVFKCRLSQVTADGLEPDNQKTKQGDVTESSSASLKASEAQGGGLNLQSATKERLNYALEMSASASHGAAAPPPRKVGEDEKQQEQLPPDGKPAASSVGHGSQLPSSSGSPGPSRSVDVKKSAADLHGRARRSFAGKYIAQVLGENHMSLKIKRRPHILESETKPEASQARPQQPGSQVQGVTINKHLSTESQAAPSKRKSCPEPPRAPKKPRTHPVLCAQCRLSKRQGHHLSQSKPKKSIVPKT